MSAISWGVGDILTLTKLAFDIYENYILVAFEAPESFRQLVSELASLKGVLRTIQEDAVCDTTFPERYEDAKKRMLERCLTASYLTLKKLDELVVRYKRIGDGEASWWKKLKWASEQSTIEDLKAKVMVHTCNLNLCMSSIANSSLLRLETSVNQALERQQEAQGTLDTADEMIGNSNGSGFRGPSKQFTDTTLVSDGVVRMLPGLSRSISVAESSLTASDDVSDNMREKGRNFGAPSVVDTVAAVMKEIFVSRQSAHALRPLRVEPQIPGHELDDELRRRFEAQKDIELQIQRHTPRDWLRVATWWLLKARANLQSCERPRSFTTHQSISPSGYSKSPDSQAYVDLLKASWILYGVILEDQNSTFLLTDDNRKIIQDLSDGLNEYFKSFHAVDIPDKETLLAQNLKIWEPMQPGEEVLQSHDLLPGLENRRWITTELKDAGEEDEHVIYRTFVNAAIGGKRSRVRSRGAPYMLLLSTKEGESEPKLTICNQSGTLSMTRDFTREDLQEPIPVTSPVSGMELVDNIDAVPFSFGRLNVSVGFTHEDEMRKFMYIPEAYFNGVRRREPRQLENATETLLFRSSVEEYEQLKASTTKPWNPRQKWQSCDLRILETTCREGWRTTRRLVVSSSASHKTPWCTEYFLPLSRVQISRVGMDRQVTMRWSDCSHEVANRKDASGYHPLYTYVYNDSNPNIALNLVFRNQKDATEFEKTVLQLSLTPIYSFSTGSDPRHVYNVSDTEPKPKQYKAILLTHTPHDWTYTELFYMYQNTNYQYEHSAPHVRLLEVYHITYISTHVDKLYPPPPTQPPRFSHCEKTLVSTPALIDFDTPSIAQTFMSSLTLAHHLIFSRRALHISTRPPSRFVSHRSSKKGPAEVQLWRKGPSTRLVSRWGDMVEDKWLTIALPADGGGGGFDTGSSGRDSNRVVLPRVEFQRGRQIDMANLVARNAREGEVEGTGKVGPVTIAFESVRDREDFAAALHGTVPAGMATAVGDLIGFS